MNDKRDSDELIEFLPSNKILILTAFLAANACFPTMRLAKVRAVSDEVFVFFSSDTPYIETIVKPESFKDKSPDLSNSFLISSIQNFEYVKRDIYFYRKFYI